MKLVAREMRIVSKAESTGVLESPLTMMHRAKDGIYSFGDNYYLYIGSQFAIDYFVLTDDFVKYGIKVETQERD